MSLISCLPDPWRYFLQHDVCNVVLDQPKAEVHSGLDLGNLKGEVEFLSLH
jgi:hypothetical protein